MASNQASMVRRQRERLRQQKRREKQAKREARREMKREGGSVVEGTDDSGIDWDAAVRHRSLEEIEAEEAGGEEVESEPEEES